MAIDTSITTGTDIDLETKGRKRSIALSYGEAFPDPGFLARAKSPEEAKRAGAALTHWVDTQEEAQKTALSAMRLHLVRHRLMRAGHQWISTRDGETWREVNATVNRIRRVFNILGPGLAFRINLLAEQRPGWRAEPLPGGGTDGRETSEAQQSIVEWYFKNQYIWPLILGSATDAQTDGVNFLEVYIDKVRGPKDRKGRYQGEIYTRRVEAPYVLIDPEALSIHREQPAGWAVVSRPRSIQAARRELEDPDLQPDDECRVFDPMRLSLAGPTTSYRGAMPPWPVSRLSDRGERVWDRTVYLADSYLFPGGRWYRVLGDKLVASGSLPGGVIPLVPVYDGSVDGQLFKRPDMTDWVDDQVSINALGSRLLEYARTFSGQKLLALKDTQLTESFTTLVGGVVYYSGPKPDLMNAPSASRDLWALFEGAVRRLEDLMGYNDLARGKLGGQSEAGFQDVSGRAALAAREMYERQFGPMIRAVAVASSEWAEIMVKYATYLFEHSPRMIPRAGRPDLAKRITSEALSGDPTVYMDPETLMPLPRALRNQMLFDHLQAGLITVDEYRKRAPYAEVRNLAMGDLDQWNRAQWINTILEENWQDLEDKEPEELWSSATKLAVLYQDDPEIHMRALNELVLDEKKEWGLRRLAFNRWGIYSDLDASKNFPPEMLAQGVPRPPVPAEVVGVPPSVLQASRESEQKKAFPGGTGDVPGAAAVPGAAPAPEAGGTAVPAAAGDQAQPLGTYGPAEAASAMGS